MPSFDGTSIVSLISWVWTDISTTLAIGLTNCSPDFRVVGRTLPEHIDDADVTGADGGEDGRHGQQGQQSHDSEQPGDDAAAQVLTTSDPPHRERDDEEHAEEEETHRSTSCN